MKCLYAFGEEPVAKDKHVLPWMQIFKINTKHFVLHPNYYFLNGQNLPQTQYFVISKKKDMNKEEKEYKEKGIPDLPTLGLGILLRSIIYLGKGQTGKVILLESEKISPVTVIRQC